MQGTVVSFAENSSAAPLGAHVVIQTATGQVDVARILQKGSQTLALRSTRGFPLRPVPKAGKAEAGVL